MSKEIPRGKMMVMPSNNTGFECGYIAGQFPGRIGHLMPADSVTAPRLETPWALDNGAFGAWDKGREWSERPFYNFLDKFAAWKPMWAVVPDWPGDRDRTLRLWEKHHKVVAAYGVPLAFCVQDGMTQADVPQEASTIFVGGSDVFKWRSLPMWCELNDHVHVGRVNTYKLLFQADAAGAESTDGTGWFRGDRKQLAGLIEYLKESSLDQRPQMELL